MDNTSPPYFTTGRNRHGDNSGRGHGERDRHETPHALSVGRPDHREDFTGAFVGPPVNNPSTPLPANNYLLTGQPDASSLASPFATSTNAVALGDINAVPAPGSVGIDRSVSDEANHRLAHAHLEPITARYGLSPFATNPLYSPAYRFAHQPGPALPGNGRSHPTGTYFPPPGVEFRHQRLAPRRASRSRAMNRGGYAGPSFQNSAIQNTFPPLAPRRVVSSPVIIDQQDRTHTASPSLYVQAPPTATATPAPQRVVPSPVIIDLQEYTPPGSPSLSIQAREAVAAERVASSPAVMNQPEETHPSSPSPTAQVPPRAAAAAPRVASSPVIMSQPGHPSPSSASFTTQAPPTAPAARRVASSPVVANQPRYENPSLSGGMQTKESSEPTVSAAELASTEVTRETTTSQSAPQTSGRKRRRSRSARATVRLSPDTSPANK
ncbi:MAG: hypothetical protein M1821_008728 [Bathelium mastoideum]|nr:MAG: hypothetical protein M1821_008728 [Bathelium mastoideum]